jgi:hypothetical protein
MLQALKDDRVIEVRRENGRLSDNLFYQMRADHDCHWLYLCHVNRKRNCVDLPEKYIIRIKGSWKVTLFDTLTGEIRDIPSQYRDKDTYLNYSMYPEDSLLLQLTQAEAAGSETVSEGTMAFGSFLTSLDTSGYRDTVILNKPEGFALSEPNILLLDYASYRLNDGELRPKQEILRLDNEIRSILGYPLRRDAYSQPWRLQKAETPEDMVTLYYEFRSEIEADNILLAMERLEDAKIYLNDQPVNGKVTGYYVDSFIHTVALPPVRRGTNRLTIELPFGRGTNLENIYILGNFGVELKGRSAYIVNAPESLEFGDITRQGLAFYTGNVDYRFKVVCSEDREVIVSVPHFSSPVMEVFVDGVSKGLIAFAPHKLSLGKLEAGEHRMVIRLYGNRFNGFGTLHNCNDEFKWYGPDSYRTTGSQWSDSYGVRPVGILSRVELMER